MAYYNIWCTSTAILLPLLFNILSGLFFIHGDIEISNFTDENTTYTFAKDIDML